MHRNLIVALLGCTPWFTLAACGDAAARAGLEETPPVEQLVARPTAAPPVAAAPPVLAPRDKAPKHIRGIYLTAYAAGSPTRLPKLLALADRTEINAFVFDLKGEAGIHYASNIPLAKELSRPGDVAIRDLRALVDTLHAHGVHAIGRIVVFKDPRLSRAKADWSIRKPDGGTWVDKAGYTWVSAWDPRVWDHNIRIAEEAARAGVDEIQFDYVRFPEPYKSLPPQVHPHAKGNRTEAIQGFLAEAKRRIHPLGATVTADVFGLSMNEATDVGIGQQWEAISAAADHILPMVYPSHYFPTHLRGIPRPNRMPYETVYKSVAMGVIRNQRLQAAGTRPARIIPWLQGFSAPWVDKNFPYGPEQAAAQIRAVHDLGLEDWIFWDPNVRYERIEAAFAATESSRARQFAASSELTSSVDRFERERTGASRVRAAAPVRTAATPPETQPTRKAAPARAAASKPNPKPRPKSKPKPRPAARPAPKLLGTPVQPSTPDTTP